MRFFIIFPHYNGTKKGLVYLALEFLFLVASVAILLLTVNSPNFIASMFPPQDFGVTLSLLKTYNLFYKVLIGGFIINITMLMVGCSFCLWKIYSKKLASMFAPVFYTILIMGLGILLPSVMIFSEEVFSLTEQSAQDIQQIESNHLSTMTVFFAKLTYESSMPGPYSSSVAKPLMRYGATDIIANKATGWVNVLIPHGLGFELKSNESYRESQSISHNQENTQKFTLYYTDNFKLVVKIERVP